MNAAMAVSTYHGWHAFNSHAPAGNRTLAEVGDAARHANVAVTSRYLHVAVETSSAGSFFAGFSKSMKASRESNRFFPGFRPDEFPNLLPPAKDSICRSAQTVNDLPLQFWHWHIKLKGLRSVIWTVPQLHSNATGNYLLGVENEPSTWRLGKVNYRRSRQGRSCQPPQRVRCICCSRSARQCRRNSGKPAYENWSAKFARLRDGLACHQQLAEQHP